jgi:hypothetical protein
MYLGRLDYGSEAQMRSSDDQNQRWKISRDCRFCYA